jgi:hypothetical protein
VTQNDPTDHALAAIASILDHPVETPVVRVEDKAQASTETGDDEHIAPTPTPEPEPIDVDNYVRIGPGPLDAIRFRWSARRDVSGDYFVDETIGSNSRPTTSGPMPKHEVVGFIDAKANDAQRRFDALKSEMTLARPAPDDRHHDAGTDDQ